jgi:hypothetical protein
MRTWNRCYSPVHQDDASSSDCVTSSGREIKEVLKEVFLWFKALPGGFCRRTEKNNKQYPESE